MDAIKKFELNVDIALSKILDKEFTYPTKLSIPLLELEQRCVGLPLLVNYKNCILDVVEIKNRGEKTWLRCKVLSGKCEAKMFGTGSYAPIEIPHYVTLYQHNLWQYADIIEEKKFVIKNLGFNFSWSGTNFDIDVLNNTSMLNEFDTKWKDIVT
jgi:hypothetical protein